MKSIKLNKKLSAFLKIALSFALLYFVLTKIPIAELLGLWTSLNLKYLVLGSILFLSSQILSVKRLEYYLLANGFNLTFKSNLKLYFLGMFYNFFIPGGVGGDAYKVFILNKSFDWSVKRLSLSILNDRISGLVALLAIAVLLSLFLFPTYWIILSIALLLGLTLYMILLTRLFKTFKDLFTIGLFFSLIIQSLQALSFIVLLKSLGGIENYIPYALLFLTSSLLSLISFAGIGIREFLFLKASSIFQVDPSISVSASLLFTVVTAFFALFGIFFQIRSLNLKTKTSL